MGKITEPLPVKLIFSVFTNKDELFSKAAEKINDIFGEIETSSHRFKFDHTEYYEEEFGENLYRKFFVIKTLYKRDGIEKTKILTNEIENSFSEKGKRTLNIDPGYLSLENFILFTTKNYTHRIYLRKGIFADLTLLFQNKRFNTLPWTYPDYASDEIRHFLKEIRKIYSLQIKENKEILNAKNVL
jgi:hypothetical protein